MVTWEEQRWERRLSMFERSSDPPPESCRRPRRLSASRRCTSWHASTTRRRWSRRYRDRRLWTPYGSPPRSRCPSSCRHHGQELREDDGAVIVDVDSVDHVLHLALGRVLAERAHHRAEFFGGDFAWMWVLVGMGRLDAGESTIAFFVLWFGQYNVVTRGGVSITPPITWPSCQQLRSSSSVKCSFSSNLIEPHVGSHHSNSSASGSSP